MYKPYKMPNHLEVNHFKLTPSVIEVGHKMKMYMIEQLIKGLKIYIKTKENLVISEQVDYFLS